MSSLMTYCKIDNLAETVNDVLEDYNQKVVNETKSESQKAMDELVAETKATAPVGKRRRGHYRDSITSDVDEETAMKLVMVWYVKGSNYRLSHLLNNGHALRDGGHYSGTKFITTAHDKIVQNYVKKIEEIVRNG